MKDRNFPGLEHQDRNTLEYAVKHHTDKPVLDYPAPGHPPRPMYDVTARDVVHLMTLFKRLADDHERQIQGDILSRINGYHQGAANTFRICAEALKDFAPGTDLPTPPVNGVQSAPSC